MRSSSILLVALLVASVYCECDPSTACNAECTNLGFTTNAGDATKPCVVPDCTTGSKCGGASVVQACLLIGYTNNNGVCVAPKETDCMKAGSTLCAYPQSICASSLGFKKNAADKTCVFPTDCTTGNKCAGNTLVKACIALGYISNAGVCALPQVTDCVKATAGQCTFTQSVCITNLGLSKSATSTDCVAPKDADCLKATSSLCGQATYYCVATLGFTKSNTNNDCVAPADCKVKNGGLCIATKTYCKSQGYTKSATNDDCTCDTTKNTDSSNKCTEISKSNGIIITGSAILALISLIF